MSSIFGKLRDGIEQAATRVQSTVQEKTQEARLRSEHRTIEREKADQIVALGTTLYEMYKLGEIKTEDLDPPLQALAATDRRLEEKQKEIDELLAAAAAAHAAANPPPETTHTPETSGERRCSCGAAIPANARFCPECGKSTAPVPPPPPEAAVDEGI